MKKTLMCLVLFLFLFFLRMAHASLAFVAGGCNRYVCAQGCMRSFMRACVHACVICDVCAFTCVIGEGYEIQGAYSMRGMCMLKSTNECINANGPQSHKLFDYPQSPLPMRFSLSAYPQMPTCRQMVSFLLTAAGRRWS